MAAKHSAVVDAGLSPTLPPADETRLKSPRPKSASRADKSGQAGTPKEALNREITFAEASASAAEATVPLAKPGDMLILRPRILTGSRIPCIKEEVPVRAMILPDGQVFVSPRVSSNTPDDQGEGAGNTDWIRKLRADANAAPKHRRYCFFAMAAGGGGGGVEPWGEVKLSKAIGRMSPDDKGLVIRGSSGRTYGRTGDRFSPSPPSAASEDTNDAPEESTSQQGGLQGIHVAQFIFPVAPAGSPSSAGQPTPSASETAVQAYATESCIVTFDLQNLNTIPPAVRKDVMINIEKHMSDTVVRILTHKFVALHAEWRRSTGQEQQSDADQAASAAAAVIDTDAERKKKDRFVLAVAKGTLYFESEACAYLSGLKALGSDAQAADLSALVEALRIRQTKVAGGSPANDGRGKTNDANQARMLVYECDGTVTRLRGKTKDDP